MADFAKWSVAAEPTLGLRPGSFLNAYAGNRTEATTLALESSPVVPHICAILDANEKWTGTASELLSAINSQASEKSTKEIGCPKTPRALSGALRRLAPNLRAIGIDITFLGRESGRRPIALKRLGGGPSISSQPIGAAKDMASLLTCPNNVTHDDYDGRDDKAAPTEIEL
jgi:hypothetical protein